MTIVVLEKTHRWEDSWGKIDCREYTKKPHHAMELLQMPLSLLSLVFSDVVRGESPPTDSTAVVRDDFHNSSKKVPQSYFGG